MKYLVLVKRGSRISKIKWKNSAETALSKYNCWLIWGEILPKWYFFSFQIWSLHVILMMSKLFHRVDNIVEVNQHYAYHHHSWRTIYSTGVESESTINKNFNYIKFYFCHLFTISILVGYFYVKIHRKSTMIWNANF